MKYLAQSVPGLQGVAWEHLSRDLAAPHLALEEDGLLVFEADDRPQRLRTVRYLNNVFLVLDQVAGADDIDTAVRLVSQRTDWHRELGRAVTSKERTFRVMVLDEGRPAAGDRGALGRVRATVERLTELAHSPRGGDAEFWILRRQSGQAFFVKRLSRRSRTEKDLRKGELRPELAHLLCLLSEPRPDDVFLDAFAGTGAIPFARTFYPYNLIFAFDAERANARLMRSRIKEGRDLQVRKGSPVIVGVEDARRLERLETGFVHKVVTDPPWGAFDTSLTDLPELYRDVLAELCRVTARSGILVVLLGDHELAARLSREREGELELRATYNVLVSGKKAVVYKWRRL